jgi:hypothetical protein
VYEYANYGKKVITKEFVMSPDSLVQMAMQLAYYRDQHEIGLTYEASMVRFFRHGRTETIRSVYGAPPSLSTNLP